MPVVNIKYKIYNKSSNEVSSSFCKGLLNDNTLTFIEDNIQNKLSFKNNKVIFIRKLKSNEEFNFEFNEGTNSILKYKNACNILEIPLYTKKISCKSNQINIDYIIDSKEEISLVIDYEL